MIFGVKPPNLLKEVGRSQSRLRRTTVEQSAVQDPQDYELKEQRMSATAAQWA
jgi:hypothetical protein